MSYEPALGDFEGIDNGRGGTGYLGFVEGFHVVGFQDPSRGADIGDGKRCRSVLHPEDDGSGVREDKNHSFGVIEIGAAHESAFPGGIIGGNLHGEGIATQGECGFWEMKLRGWSCLGDRDGWKRCLG